MSSLGDRVSGLPTHLAIELRWPRPSARWYVAWHPDTLVGALRAKDGEGLDIWARRDWKMFPTAPHVADVTDAFKQLWADTALSEPVEIDARVVLAIHDGVAMMSLRKVSDGPLPGQVADVTRTFWEILRDASGVGMPRRSLVFLHGVRPS